MSAITDDKYMRQSKSSMTSTSLLAIELTGLSHKKIVAYRLQLEVSKSAKRSKATKTPVRIVECMRLTASCAKTPGSNALTVVLATQQVRSHAYAYKSYNEG